jgi:hypothetical protein
MSRSITDINKDIVVQKQIIMNNESSEEQINAANKKMKTLNAELRKWFKNNI